MIDLIEIHRKGLTDDEVDRIVKVNSLQTNSKDGKVWFDNEKTKNLEQSQSVYIAIETSNKLKIECSLHKYYNKLKYGDYENYDFFDMGKACQAINMLMERKSLPEDMEVYNFEIGLNLNLSKDCRKYMDKMIGIGIKGEEKKLYSNARYKDERQKTTVFHNHIRKYFKVYDKVFEMRDRKRRNIPDGNILRIETCFRRVEKKKVQDLFSEANLKKIMEQFFRDWRTACFEQDVLTPKGTSRAKQDLCLKIIKNGRDYVLNNAKERYETGALTQKGYRNIKEFVRYGFDEIKDHVSIVKSPEETEYHNKISMYYELVKGTKNSCPFGNEI